MENNTQWEQLREKLNQYINVDLKEIIISNARNKESVTKIKVRPVMLKNDLVYQVSFFKGKQVFHENMKVEALCDDCIKWLQNDFGQMEVHHEQGTLICLTNKKGTLTVKEKRSAGEQPKLAEKRLQELSHNRKKKYIYLVHIFMNLIKNPCNK